MELLKNLQIYSYLIQVINQKNILIIHSYLYFLEVLQGTVASAIASITYNNMANQMLAASTGALKLIVDLMQDREFGLRYKGALAVEALAINNVENQKQFLSQHLNVQKPINELMEVKTKI